MELTINKADKAKLTVGGVVYPMTIPSALVSSEYSDKIKAMGEGKQSEIVKVTIKYLVYLGLSEEIAKELGIADMLEIIKFLSGEEKKS